MVADSVLKETFHQVAREPGRYPMNPAAVRPWLVLSALSVLHDGERYAPAGHDDRPPVPRSQEWPPPPAPAPSVSGTTIIAAMADLPADERELIVDLFYRGVTLDEAAAARGVRVATLKSLLYYAMRTLRTVLDQHVATGTTSSNSASGTRRSAGEG